MKAVVYGTSNPIYAHVLLDDLETSEEPFSEETNSNVESRFQFEYINLEGRLVGFFSYLSDNLRNLADIKGNPYRLKIISVAQELKEATDHVKRNLDELSEAHNKIRRPLSQS